MKPAIIALTLRGVETGKVIRHAFPGSVLYTMPGRGDSSSVDIDSPLGELAGRLFKSWDTIIFVSAAGIAVRSIAPHIKDKTADPAVLVIDEKGRFVISLLSGHIGGGNRAAELVAEKTGAVPVITTSSDLNGFLSPDMIAKKYGCVIDDMERCKEVTSVLVNGGTVAFLSESVPVPEHYADTVECADAIVYLTSRIVERCRVPYMQLIPRNIVIGTGCRRGTSPDSLIGFISSKIHEAGIDRRAVKLMASIDLKSDEPAVREAAEYFGAETLFFTPAELESVSGIFERSEFVKEKTGASSVCEPAAYLAAGEESLAVLGKQSENGMTMSIREIPLREVEYEG